MDLREAWDLGRKLMDEHGLERWRLRYTQAKTRAGACHYRDELITLSAPVTRIHPDDEVRETVLHEIAHALVGPEAAHGPVWAAKAREIGATGERCVPADLPRVPGSWVGICSAGHSIDRHRRPEKPLLCGVCPDEVPKIERVFTWLRDGRPGEMHLNYLELLDAFREGRRVIRYVPGSHVRIVREGDLNGRCGTVRKIGRTRYEIDLGGEIWQIPFRFIEPA